MTDGGDRAARRVELVTGAVFVVAGVPKFVAFGFERDNFERFGLPAPAAWVIAAGVIEILGGIALLRGGRLVPAAGPLAITMCVAIVASGVLQGDVVPSLTLAPALLAALLFLLIRAAARGRARPSRPPSPRS